MLRPRGQIIWLRPHSFWPRPHGIWPGFGVREHDDRGAKGASIQAPSGVGYGEGCPLRSRLGGLGERCELPSEVRGGARAAITFSAYFRPQNASGSKKNTACIILQGARAPVPRPHAWRRHRLTEIGLEYLQCT